MCLGWHHIANMAGRADWEKAGFLAPQWRSCSVPSTAHFQTSVMRESDFPSTQASFSWASCCLQPKAC